MKNDINNSIEAYESMLPHGAKNEIAIRAGVTRQAVSQFFSGRTRSRRIEDATLLYIAELKREREIKLRNAGLL